MALFRAQIKGVRARLQAQLFFCFNCHCHSSCLCFFSVPSFNLLFLPSWVSFLLSFFLYFCPSCLQIPKMQKHVEIVEKKKLLGMLKLFHMFIIGNIFNFQFVFQLFRNPSQRPKTFLCSFSFCLFMYVFASVHKKMCFPPGDD